MQIPERLMPVSHPSDLLTTDGETIGMKHRSHHLVRRRTTLARSFALPWGRGPQLPSSCPFIKCSGRSAAQRHQKAWRTGEPWTVLVASRSRGFASHSQGSGVEQRFFLFVA